MATARKRLIDLEATSYYHCCCRCVRRAFLTGTDHYSGKDCSYRRHWIEERIFQVAKVYAIDVCAYAVMENHYHVVLHVNKSSPIKWTFTEIFTRWTKLHKPHELVSRYFSSEKLDSEEMLELAALAAEYRRRLMSISWFMREVNEPIARKANDEDERKGRFWESRYASQALVDDTAILSCMAYVDLNPIRAGIKQTPEQSDFTSIQVRIRNLLSSSKDLTKPLKTFVDEGSEAQIDGPFGNISLKEYLSLVDWSGRVIKKDKAGAIPANIAPILSRLELDEEEWTIRTKHFRKRFKCAAGFWDSLVIAAKKFNRQWLQGKPPQSYNDI